MITPKDAGNFLRSTQKSLLGKVTPNLRAVTADFQTETSFEFIFYYDKPLTEDEKELPSLAYASIASDFPAPEFKSSLVVKIYPYPDKIPSDRFWLYKRYEESYNSEK